jgi:hypothetical protein
MAVPSNGPVVPLNSAELLYVALRRVLQDIQQKGYVPIADRAGIQHVLQAYDRDRTLMLSGRGVPPQVVARYTQHAAEKLDKWLTKQAPDAPVDESYLNWLEESFNEPDHP